jgi:hypothetical protein
MTKELYLAEEAMRLLLILSCWFTLYGVSLFLTLAAGPGLWQSVGIVATLCSAYLCVRTGLQLYRVNKTMRDINQ